MSLELVVIEGPHSGHHFTLNVGGNLMLGTPPLARPEDAAQRVLDAIKSGDPLLSPQITIAAAPLMPMPNASLRA